MKINQKIIALSIIISALMLSGLLVFRNLDHELKFGFPVTTKPTETVILGTQENSTKNIAQKIAKSFIEENPSGPMSPEGELGIFAKNPEEIVDEILSASTDETTQKVLSPKLHFEDLKTIKNASGKDIAFYFSSREGIIASANQRVKERGASLSSPSVSNLTVFLEVTSRAISELYNLPVPEEVLPIHKEQIRLLAIQEKIFENLVNYERDPMAASVSVSLLFSMTEDLEALSQTISNFIKENNIEI